MATAALPGQFAFRRPWIVACTATGAATATAMQWSVSRSGAGNALTTCVELGVVAFGVRMGLTRQLQGGVRLAALNMVDSPPCPGIDVGDGPVCANHFRAPKGEGLVAAILPSGRVGKVCRPCAASIGQGAVRVMAEVVSTGPQRELTGVVDGEIEEV